ncbi:Bug family tripartite tricarboxylate transporter substrate binding protein [Alkalilacustris brevis]|uniref:Bug family tripartite tricarboxylate transporter substrate binding protein n=1 Tax=Alkalilacustris brevis TaxID=2026338 RepID=UPI000E0D8862|nr:tripartite tricarboxylate transporter substrate-binding protein [Alkalilacustris brevis]
MRNKIKLMATGSAAILALVTPALANDWPTGPLTLYVVSSPGGGFDAAARQPQPYLEEALGVPLRVENRPGGNTAVATNLVYETGDDCTNILLTGIPHIHFSALTQQVNYEYEDFYPIAGLTSEPGLVRVRDEAPWQSMNDLIEDALERPGEITASVAFYTNNYYMGILDIMQATGTDFNIVPFGGGADARNALLRGEVDFTHAGVFNSRNVEEGTRVLGIHYSENRWPEITDDATPIKDQLGVDLDDNESSYGVFVTAACRENHPERFATLVEAFHSAKHNEDYLAMLEAGGELGKVAYVDPETYHAANLRQYDIIAELVATREEFTAAD